MNETKQERQSQAWRGVQEEEAVQRLLKEAGPRPAISEEDLASIKAAAHAEWRRRYGEQFSKPPVRLWMSLAAAALLAAVGLIWWARMPGPPPASTPAAASLELLTGVALSRASGEGSPPSVQLLPGAVGQPLPAGSELETGAEPERLGRIALRMAGGASVRLDAGTRVRLASATVVELTRGAIYVDTGAEPDGREEVAVRTPAGLFQGVGTQFEVRAEGGEAVTRLRVREGSVILDRGAESVRTEAGGELIVRGDGSLAPGQVDAFGPEWDWVLKTAPMLEIEGVKVRRFLDWIARENGWRIELSGQEAVSLADSVVLHGSIDHLTPADATRVVLSSCGLGHRVSDGTLVVFVAEHPAP